MNSISTYIPDKRTKTIAIAIIGGMFCIFGFVSWVNAILIPFFKIARELTNFQSYFVIFSFYIAYFAMVVSSEIFLKKVDFNRGIIYNFCLMSLGALAMFLHAGCQVIAIDTIISYANSMRIDLLEAKIFISYTLAATICGCIVGIILIPKYVLKKNAHVFCMILNKFSISNLVTLDI